jgi:hypothetical protein
MECENFIMLAVSLYVVEALERAQIKISRLPFHVKSLPPEGGKLFISCLGVKLLSNLGYLKQLLIFIDLNQQPTP